MSQKKILIFTKNWLGDVIFEEPFIRTLHRQYDNPYIICVTPSRCQQILDANPHIHTVLTFDDRHEDKGISSRIRLIRKIRTMKIDIAFLLHRSFSRALILFFAGIPERYGYGTKGRGFLLTRSVKEPKEYLHRVDYCLNVLRSLGIYVPQENDEKYRFYFAEDDIAQSMSLLQASNIQPKSFVVLNTGANWEKKRWGLTQFAYLADALAKQYSVPIVMTGSSADESRVQDIIAQCREVQPISLCGKTNIVQLGALFSLARLVISADSGPLHIASGVGAPVVALFGPTDPRITGPRGVGQYFTLQKIDKECRIPCYDEECTNNVCMAAVQVEDIIDIINRNQLL